MPQLCNKMDGAIATHIRCGEFEVDLRAGEVYGAGRRLRLQEQPFQVLEILINSAGKLVTRDDIKKKLWPNDTIVEFDTAINTAVKKLRLVFGDSNKEPRYIETVARRGYRFIMPIESLDSSADLGRPGAPPVTSLEPEPVALSGSTVSHYRVLGVIGGGGMGVVYRAEDLKLDRAVAIKFLPEEMGTNQRAIDRFEREARAASALDHPNVCSIFEFGEYEGRAFIVMPLLRGETLRDKLATSEEPLALPEAIDIAIQVVSGLEAAHEKGIIHRDIKPANILVTTKGLVKILDFGLAKMLEAPEEVIHSGGSAEVSGPMEMSVSREGVAIGTAGYMSPEQIRGEKLDARTDIFSFGLVLYEMVTGRRAFSGETAEQVREAILHDVPVPADQLNPAISPELQHIINLTLEKSRDLRYQSAAEVLADLRELQEAHDDAPRPVEQPQRRRWSWTALVAAVALLVSISYGWYRSMHRAPALTEKDTIVLADFVNTSGDAVFDDSLRQALTSQLNQSPYINLLSERRIISALKQMERSPDQSLTTEVATEVCQRTHSQAVLAGSIAREGSAYPLTLKLLSCQTGHPLAVVTARAADRDQVLKVLDEAANEMRMRMGESLASVSKFDQPLPEATTSSLDALKAFSEAKKYSTPTDSIPKMKRALELDPNFAMAYAELGAAYMNVGEARLGAENIRKAYELRERTTQRERFYIEMTYYTLQTRELEKAEQSGKEWEQSYPSDGGAPNNLAIIYAELGKLPEAVAETKEVLRLQPDNSGAPGNLIGMLSAVDRFSEAEAVYEQARSHGLDNPYLRQYKYVLAFLQGDKAGMQEQVEWAQGLPRTQNVLLTAQSDTEFYYGRVHKAREFTSRAVDAAKAADQNESAATSLSGSAMREAEVGNFAQAREAVSEALALSDGHDVRTYAAVALARAGDVARAQQIAQDLSREFPMDTTLQNYSLPCIYAAIQIQQHKALQAVESLRLGTRYELSQGTLTNLYVSYLRGEAYLQAGQADKAAAEFQKMLQHPGLMQNYVTGALAHLQLGRAQAMMGDNAGARNSYQEFLTLWQGADADVPIYQQAKAEYASLQQRAAAGNDSSLGN